MKDYRLSEIQNHNWNRLWDLGDDIAKRRLEFEFLRKAQYSLEHLDIEPRDMIELPCNVTTNGGEGRGLLYTTLARDKKDGTVHFMTTDDKKYADEFLAAVKKNDCDFARAVLAMDMKNILKKKRWI